MPSVSVIVKNLETLSLRPIRYDTYHELENHRGSSVMHRCDMDSPPIFLSFFFFFGSISMVARFVVLFQRSAFTVRPVLPVGRGELNPTPPTPKPREERPTYLLYPPLQDT